MTMHKRASHHPLTDHHHTTLTTTSTTPLRQLQLRIMSLFTFQNLHPALLMFLSPTVAVAYLPLVVLD